MHRPCPHRNRVVEPNAWGTWRASAARIALGTMLLIFQASPAHSADSPCTNAPPGIVSWWQAESNALDSIGTNHGLSLNGVTFAPGKVGQAFSFNSSTNRIQVSTNGLNVGAGDFTVEGWIKSSSVRDYNAILSFDGFNPAIYFRSDGRLVLYPHQGASAGGINDGRFHHFAVARTSGQVTYYKDGFPAGTAPGATPLNAQNILIGSDTVAGDQFEGLIDELTFYNRALTSNEVKKIFLQGSGGKCSIVSNPPPPAAIADYRFEYSLGSAVGTPPDLQPISSTTFTNATVDGSERTVLAFPVGGGLSFAPTTGLVPNNNYSVVMLMRFDAVNGWRRILDTYGGSDEGLYSLDGVLVYYPGHSGFSPTIATSQWVQVVFTRSPDNYFAAYVDGAPQFSGTVASSKAIIGANNSLRFFKDDGGDLGSGQVARIRVFDTALTGEQVASLDRLTAASTNLPDIALSVTNLNFGSVTNGSSNELSLVISNVGSSTLSILSLTNNHPVFHVVSPAAPFSVSAGTQAVVTLRFSPTTAGQYTGNVAIASSDPDEAMLTVALSGTGVNPPPPAPDIGLNATNLDFGNVLVGQSNNLTLTVSNVGNSTLTVTSLRTNNPAFRVLSPATPFNVAVGAQTAVTLRFSPTTAGPQSGSLSITNNDPDEGALTVALTGTGVNPPNTPDIALSATNLSFGSFNVGQTADRTLTISNTGTATLTINSLATNNPAFRAVSPTTPFNVATGAQVVVTLRFSPAAAGAQSANLTIANNDPDEGALVVGLSGTGTTPPTAPDIRVSATNLHFGIVMIGQSNNLTLTVSNVGASTLTVTSLTTNNPVFRVVSPATPFNVATGSPTVVTLRFTPTSAGAVTGAVAIASNDPDEANVSVTLGGSGSTGSPPLSDPPGIVSITPTSAAPGALVTLTGTNIGATPFGTVVEFGPHAAAILSQTATEILARIPLAVGGAVPVTVFANGRTSPEFPYQVQPTPSSLRIAEVARTPTDFVRMLTQPAWPNPSELLVESADSPVGPWWKETEVGRNDTANGQEFFTPWKARYGERFFRVGAFGGQSVPFIRFVVPNKTVVPGQSVTLQGANFSPTPAENTVRFDLPNQSWTAMVTAAGSNYLVVTVPPNLPATNSGNGVLYRVTVTTAQGTGNGVGCAVWNADTFERFGISPPESFLLTDPGTRTETVAVGGGVPPYHLLPLASNQLGYADITWDGPLIRIVARPGITNAYVGLRVQDSRVQFGPQQAQADVYIRQPDFRPTFSAQLHTLLAGTAPGATMTARFSYLRPEQMELQFQNGQIELSQLFPGAILGFVRLYYSSSAYGFQHLTVTEVTNGRAKFDVISLDRGGMDIIGRGELVQNPPTLVLTALGQKPASLMPTTVDQEILLADGVVRLPAAAGQNFSIVANFTSVSANENQYAPLRSSVTNNFTTVGIGAGTPRLERLVPVHGEVSRNVSIHGTGFDPNPANNTVTFAGPEGTRLPAEIVFQTNGELVVTVPEGAITGPVRLQAAGQVGNDFTFFVRFRADAALLFSGFTNNTPTAPRFIHLQPVDEDETTGEVPIETVIATLDQGRLALTGVSTNQQVGVMTNISLYTGSKGYAPIFYKGQESAAPNRQVFQVSSSADSSTVLLRIYALDDPDGSGVTFQIVSVFVPFNAGVWWDYRFTSPIYRPPAAPGTDVAVRLETVSQRWMSLPDEMRRIINATHRVR